MRRGRPAAGRPDKSGLLANLLEANSFPSIGDAPGATLGQLFIAAISRPRDARLPTCFCAKAEKAWSISRLSRTVMNSICRPIAATPASRARVHQGTLQKAPGKRRGDPKRHLVAPRLGPVMGANGTTQEQPPRRVAAFGCAHNVGFDQSRRGIMDRATQPAGGPYRCPKYGWSQASPFGRL
jgi:hypothetical protein